jgi:predicted O-methyltransferase YrrM
MKTIAIAAAAVLILMSGVNLVAQDPPQQRQGGPGMRPPRGPEEFNKLLDELSQAYQQNDREKMGMVIEQMKQNRSRMRQRPDMPPPERRAAEPAVSSSQTSTPLAKGEAEKKIVSVLEDMAASQRRGLMNVPPYDGRILRLLTEAVGAKNVVEIGTSNGYSGIWFCLALRATGGKLITHEIDKTRASLARENFKRAGVETIVTLVEGDAHEKVADLKGPIDVLFIDADKEGYNDYLTKLLPKVRPGGLILAHNTNMRAGMEDYLKAVTTDPNLETIFVREQDAGIGITLKKN